MGGIMAISHPVRAPNPWHNPGTSPRAADASRPISLVRAARWCHRWDGRNGYRWGSWIILQWAIGGKLPCRNVYNSRNPFLWGIKYLLFEF